MSDKAKRAGEKGEEVVDEVVSSVEEVLGGTDGFLKKIAQVESR